MRVDPMNLCVIQHILRFISGYSIMHAGATRNPRESASAVRDPAFRGLRRAIADGNHVSCYHLDP
jgi:hypothetical protein